MTDPRWQRIKELFATAAETEGSGRDALLDRECAGDTELRREVESLLQARPARASGAVLAEGPGARIGPYKLLEQIGEGGFGTVFMAEQETPVRRRVALKIVKLGMDTRQVVARFEQERQALALMDHPNIARVFDGGATANGRPYFVMELVRGDPITAYCDREKLTPSERLSLFADVCRAVQHAHMKGVIHRDLKPSNVLVTIIDGRPLPKVIDFGVAKATQGPLTDKSLFTEHRQMLGTPLYMSPEQAQLSGVDVDTRSDVYSLGVLLYELLTGTTPFDSEQLLQAGIGEMHRMIRELEPVKPSTRVLTLGKSTTAIAAQRRVEPQKLGLLLRGDLDWIVMRCLEKERARRYETATELAQDVDRHLAGEAVHAAPPSAVYRLRKFVRRKSGQVAACAAVLMVALVGGVATVWQAGKAQWVQEQREFEADLARKAAHAARESAEIQAYFGNIAAADAALRANDIATVRRHLDACPESLRSWEWQYLDAESDRSLLVLRGQIGFAGRTAFSPDGGRLVTASQKAAHVWDMRSGREILTLPGGYGEMVAPRFSPDGRRILTVVSGSGQQELRLWDAVTGEELATLRGHARRVTDVAFSKDGSRLVSASEDGTARIWDAEAGRDLMTLPGHGDRLTSVAVSADGTRVATGSEDGTARVWDGRTGQVVAICRGHHEAVTNVVLSPDDYLLITASEDGTVRSWKAATGEANSIGADGGIFQQPVPLAAPDYSPAGGFLVTTASWRSPEASVQVWDLTTGWVVLLHGHENHVRTAVFDASGTRIVSASADGTARVWDARTGRQLALLRGHANDVLGAAFSPDGARVVTVSKDETIRIWDAATEESVQDLGEAPGIPIFSADGTRFMTHTGTRLTIWDSLTGHRLGGISFLLKSRAAINFDGSRVATASGSLAQVWDTFTLQPTAALVGHESSIVSLTFSRDGTRILTASEDGSARLWEAASGRPLRTLRGHAAAIREAVLSPDGALAATASEDGTARVWAAESGDVLFSLEGHGDVVVSVSFSQDGSRIVTASADDKARVWDARTGRLSAELKGHRRDLHGASFSRDGTRVLTTAADGTARVWDADTGEEIGVQKEVQSAIFSADGRRVLALDNSLFVWDPGSGTRALTLPGRDGADSAAIAPDGLRVATGIDYWDGGGRLLHRVPYRLRFIGVQPLRDALGRLRPRVERELSAGRSLAATRAALAAHHAQREERTALAILVHAVEEQRRTQARCVDQLTLDSLFTAPQDPDAIASALKAAARNVEEWPEEPDYRGTLGAVLYRAGRAADALPELRQAVAGHPTYLHRLMTSRAFLLMAHSKLGHRADADDALVMLRRIASEDRYSPAHRIWRLVQEAEAVFTSAFPGSGERR